MPIFNYVFIGCFCSITIPIILLEFWANLIKWVDLTTTFTNKQNPSAQIDYILQSPHSFINTLWNTNFFGWGDGVTQSFIGIFGWSDTALSVILVMLGYVGLAAVLIINSGEKPRWFSRSHARGVTAERVLSDNGSCYRSRLWHETCAELGITAGAKVDW